VPHIGTVHLLPKNLSVRGAPFRRCVPFACVDLELLLLALRIRDNQRTPVRPNDLDFQLVIFAVVREIRRRETNSVLTAKKCGDAPENLRDFAFKPREPCSAPGQLRKSLQLALGLKVSKGTPPGELRFG